MGRAFSEAETEKIREKLVESCQKCWTQYGYKKTSVSEICTMSGISKGSFYAFYHSKELLFVETSNQFQKKIIDLMRKGKPKNPTKRDLAEGFKLCIKQFYENQWLFSLREDYEVFIRKLPEGFLENDYKKDMLDIASILKFYRLKPKISIEKLTAVIYSILFSLYFTDTIGKHHRTAINMLIDCVIDKYF